MMTKRVLPSILCLFLALPAAGQSTATVVHDLVDAQNAVIQAAIETQRGQIDAALAAADAAMLTLTEVEGALSDPAVADAIGRKAKAIGRKVRATEKKIDKARTAIVKGKRTRIQLKKLRIASKSALKAARSVGQPVVAEIDPRSAGFHQPGETVRLQILAADGTPCGDPPVVEVVNDSFGSAVDLGSVAVDEASGVISLDMGDDQGGVRVNVSVCGDPPRTVLLYNYGPKPPKGLPRDFPTNLPPGDYQMTFSGQVAGVTIPTTTVGLFTLDDLKTFADSIVDGFRAAARAASAVPGCHMHVGYSGFDGTGFSITVRLGCSVSGVSVSGTLRFRVDHV